MILGNTGFCLKRRQTYLKRRQALYYEMFSALGCQYYYLKDYKTLLEMLMRSFWGSRDCTAGMALALYMAGIGSIPDIEYDS